MSVIKSIFNLRIFLAVCLAVFFVIPFAASADNPVPTITSISPDSKKAGTGTFTMTVEGFDFVSDSVVRFGPPTGPISDRVTTYVSSTKLKADILASDVESVGFFYVMVFNPAPGGGISEYYQGFSVTPNTNTPTITSISPTSGALGSPGLTLTVNGTNFINGQSIGRINGSNRTTLFITGEQLTMELISSDFAATGTFNITVNNPIPTGGVSNSKPFEVTNPVPVISSIAPVSVVQGSTINIDVYGSQFIEGSIIYLGNLALLTLYISSEELRSQTIELLVPGVYYVTVVSPAPGGGTSNEKPLTVTNAPPTIENMQVSSDSEYCPVEGSTGALFFSWEYSASNYLNETYFQIQIDDDLDFSSPEYVKSYAGLDYPPGTSQQQAVFVSMESLADALSFNETYYWFVEVKDSSDTSSGLINGPSYTTLPHSGPTVAFTYDPQEPLRGDLITFTNDSICYNTSGAIVACQSFLWDFGDSTTSTLENPTHTYNTVGNYTVDLQVSDELGSCIMPSGSAPTIIISPRSNLPRWREVSPLQ